MPLSPFGCQKYFPSPLLSYESIEELSVFSRDFFIPELCQNKKNLRKVEKDVF